MNTVETRLMAFVFAGCSPAWRAPSTPSPSRGVGFNTYEAADSLLVFSMAVIGGVASLGGTLAGVALVQWLGYAFPKFQLLLTGVGLLAILMLIPGGLGQAAERVRDRYARMIAKARGISLVEEFETVEAGNEEVPVPPAIEVGDWDTPGGLDAPERSAPVGGWGAGPGGSGPPRPPPPRRQRRRPGGRRRPGTPPAPSRGGWGQEPPGDADVDTAGEGLQPVPAPNGWTAPSPNHTPGPDGYGPGSANLRRWDDDPTRPSAPPAPERPNGQRPPSTVPPPPGAAGAPGRPGAPPAPAGAPGSGPAPATGPAHRSRRRPALRASPPFRPRAAVGTRTPSSRRSRPRLLTSGRPLLTADSVEASYGSLQVLFGIDAGIGEHEMVALLGTNGAGKSTLLKAVSGLLPPNKGKVMFDGKDIRPCRPRRSQRWACRSCPAARASSRR